MHEPLRIGIVGCGFATQDRHLPAISRMPQVECVALADANRVTLDEVAERWRVPRRYLDATELARDPDVEAVAVCVPAASHVEVALIALAHGRHVLVEKPVALSLDDADRLIERAEAVPVKVLVGFNLRWHRLVVQARDVLRSGGLGRIQAVRTVFSDSTLARPELPEWRRSRASGGGSLLDKGVHHFDLVRYLLGEDFAVVAAGSSGRHADDEVVTISGRTTGGALVSMLMMDAATLGNELTLYGDEASLHVDCYRSDGFELRGLSDVPGAARTRLRRIASSLEQLGGHLGELHRGGVFDASYRAEWRHFADAVRLDLEPECSLEDGRQALRVALAAAQAATLGRPVEVGLSPGSSADVSPASGISVDR